MARLIFTPHFDRVYSRFTRRHAQRRECVDRALTRLENDPRDPRLKTHGLTGEHAGLFACSCGFDCRIRFDWLRRGQSDEAVLLLDVGTHDQVY